jgi:diacylglycerol kinase (ATP)
MQKRVVKVTKRDAKHAVIIINPVSGQGDPKERRKMLLTLARKHSWHGTVEETTKSRGAGAIAASAIKKGQKEFIVCGGDGTIMEVLDIAAEKDVVIGVIPLGTGNLFAQNLGIPLDSESAMDIVFTGKVLLIDVGRANGIFFSIMAGMGLDAEVMRDADRKLKNKLGLFAYIVSGLKRLPAKPGRYLLQIDNKQPQTYQAKSILVANLGRITGGIKAVPKAHPQSGKLQVGIIRATVWYAWVSLLFNAVRGNINKSPHYTLTSGKDILIESLKEPRPFQCDGEDFPPVTRLAIQIYPASLAVRVP